MTLAIGTQAPGFRVQDTHGNLVSLADFSGKTVILYFYPKDDTPGCTKEACSFRDAYADYKGKEVVVLGVSVDDSDSHQAFSDKFHLPFPLLADVNAVITRAYDVATERNGVTYARRVTYVIDPHGRIQRVYETVNTETHARDILQDLGL